MVEMEQVTQLAMAGFSGIMGVVGANFWFKRWVDKTDKTLDGIQEKLTTIQVQNAVMYQKFESNDLIHRTLEKSIENLKEGRAK